MRSGSAAWGKSDKDGKLTLKLPPGDYQLMADPARGAAYIRTYQALVVKDAPPAQPIELSLSLGCVLVLKALDAKTGAGIPGVSFWYEKNERTGSSRWQVQSDTTYIDNPLTDDHGELRTVVDPGTRLIGVGFGPLPGDYKMAFQEERKGRQIELPAGQTVTVQFKLSKPADPAKAADDAKADQKAKEAAAEAAKKLRSPQIIIAQHVLLWDGRIVTWDEILTRFRLMRREGPFHPSFKDTTGLYANKVQGWQFWHDRIMGVYKELFQPDGVSFGSISPRGSKVYDAIVTEDDLTPDPAQGRKGRLLDANGKPAAGAQVVLLPIDDNLEVSLDGTKLRYPYDECWTTTNEKGEFTIYPKDEEFFIATLHPSGFALQRGTTKNDKQLPVELNLQLWATVTFSSTGETENQSGHISCHPLGDAQGWPEFAVSEIKTKGKPIAIQVPSGKIDVSRSLIIKEGTAISLPFETFSLKPSEEKTMEIKPASKEDKARANEIYNQLHPPNAK